MSGIILNKAPKADPNFDNVSLLIHMDGANGSNSFIDSSKNNFSISNVGNVIQSNTTAKFGNASAYFNGSSDLRITHNNAFEFESNDFTIEFWININKTQGNPLVTKWLNTDPLQQAFLIFYSNNQVETYINGSFFRGGGALNLNTWQHVAIVKNSSFIRIYVDGIEKNFRLLTNPITTSPNTPLIIGGTTTSSSKFEGYMQELRITKGIARYTSNFTPPTEPFPNTNKTNTFKFLKSSNKKIKFLKPSSLNQIVISNAGTSIFNDTYTKQNGTINGYSYWVGNTNGYYLSVIQSGPPGNFVWAVTDDTIPPIGINNGYVFYLMGPIFNPIILNYPPETTSVNSVGSAQGRAILTYLNN